MSPGPRKFFGLVLLLSFIAVYALGIVALATSTRWFASRWSELAFYAIAGLAWVPVAGWILHWMERK